MFRRSFVVAFVATLGSTAVSQAEPAAGTTDQPKNSSQDKSSSQPASTPAPKVLRKDDIYWIGPKKPALPPSPAQPGRSGQLMPPGEIAISLRIAATYGKPFLAFYQLADRRTGSDPPLVRSDFEGFGVRGLGQQSQSQPSSRNIVVAQGTPGPRRNSYVIQFRPNVTSKQREDLLRKYDLAVQRELPSLNIVVVSRRSVPANEPAFDKLADIFNPPIIKDLRKEPFVANATVDSASSPRSIPKASDTKVKDEGGTTHQWDWKYSTPSTPSPSVLSASARPQLLDGNWGVKSVRMPPVWTIVQNYRAAKPGAVRPKLAIIDTGFSKHDDLAFNLLPTPNKEASTDVAVASVSGGDVCSRSHGNHVAGIAGAVYGNGIGVDGVIPDAKIDAVPVSDTLISDDPSATSQANLDDVLGIRAAFFSEVIFAIGSYVDIERTKSTELRVVNVSMGYNIGTLVRLGYEVKEIQSAIQDTLAGQAQMFLPLALKYEQSVLFVTAAGNDSLDFPTPLEAKWSSPIAWLAKGDIDRFLKRPKNILVVEATDRAGQRADFSNITGHVAAPGVDILSTLSNGDAAYNICSGTSQATPYAAGVAVILFELNPTKKPADIVDIMTKSAVPKPAGTIGAPRLDAFEAAISLSPDNLTRLTDLNNDGKVDIEDMKIFARYLGAIADNRAKGTPFPEDLNGDGLADANECNWPKIDFNGSGSASLSLKDAKLVQGMHRTDLDMMELAWTDKAGKVKDFKTALKETGLDIQAADIATAPVSPQACH